MCGFACSPLGGGGERAPMHAHSLGAVPVHVTQFGALQLPMFACVERYCQRMARHLYLDHARVLTLCTWRLLPGLHWNNNSQVTAYTL